MTKTTFLNSPTADDVLAKRACDLCGVTPYSEFRIHGEQIALVAIREARTSPPPVAEASDDFTLAAEEAIKFIGFVSPRVRQELIKLARRGAEIGAAREREVMNQLKTCISPNASNGEG